MPDPMSLAYFISPHGFGHAARACAIIESLHCLRPELKFSIFTSVPEWFFSQSLPACYHYEFLETDIGLVQSTAVSENLNKTISKLSEYYPLPSQLVETLAERLSIDRSLAVISDISPLGLCAANSANIPTILIENFLWDWIYSGYLHVEPRFQKFIDYLGPIFELANLHIQCAPVCRVNPQALASPPIARPLRQQSEKIRRELQLEINKPVILVTMGGGGGKLDLLEHLAGNSDFQFLVPHDAKEPRQSKNITFFPSQARFYHPDLVALSDLVIGKLGYSTVAEIYQAGTPMLYFRRPQFIESAVLERFILEHVPAEAITEQDLENDNWLKSAQRLLNRGRSIQKKSGSNIAASSIIQFL